MDESSASGVWTEVAPAAEHEIQIYCWRLEQLLVCGYSNHLADEIAADPSIDLHQACDLLARGCPPETAHRILT